LYDAVGFFNDPVVLLIMFWEFRANDKTGDIFQMLLKLKKVYSFISDIMFKKITFLGF